MEFQRAKIIAGFALLSMWTKLWWGTRKLTRFLWALGPFVVRFIGVVIVILAVIFFVLDTKRDVAYRYSVPGSAACNTQADPKNRAVLVTVGNDELAAETSNHDIRANKAFTCMLQLHALKAGKGGLAPGNAALAYYLSFLEFRENGVPAQNGRDGALLERPQISVLLDHLNEQKKNGKQNFVFAFIHGWRHDARVGDKNVQNVRLMAAYLTSFLQQRCVNEHYKRYCNVTVTAVYIGWRGARLNETRIPTAALSDFLTTPTLFDRKPVSERIAPAVISALQKIDSTLHHQENAAPDSDAKSANWFKQPRLITIGHSLGGNLLATGLRDEMVDIIQRKSDFDKPEGEKAVVRSPLGDLIVLLNPASEAENWIALQRAFHRRIGADADTLAFQ